MGLGTGSGGTALQLLADILHYSTSPGRWSGGYHTRAGALTSCNCILSITALEQELSEDKIGCCRGMHLTKLVMLHERKRAFSASCRLPRKRHVLL